MPPPPSTARDASSATAELPRLVRGHAVVDVVDRALAEIAGRARLLQAVTPLNVAAERARMESVFARDSETMPRWEHRPVADVASSLAPLAALAALARLARSVPPPLDRLYLARIEELALELRLQAAAGTASFGALAAARFAARSPEADALARRFSRAKPPRDDGPRIATDDPSPLSLRGRIAAAIEELRLPFRVRVVDGLSSLAATGAESVYVARGRLVGDRVARRTTLHEILGHAAPRARARTMPLRLFFTGTAGGHDTQEGFALWHEKRSGLLDGQRKRELGLRHVACLAMDDGATFVDVVRLLTRTHDAELAPTLGIAERIFRGSDGRAAGLGRERVYLTRFREVEAHLTAHPLDETLLGSGQLGLDALPVLSGLAHGTMAACSSA